MTCEYPDRAAMTAYTKGCRCDRCTTASREYRAEWREKNREATRAYDQAYKKARPELRARNTAYQADRRARIASAYQEMSREEFMAIKELYAEARRLTDTTGVPHEVDHVVALVNGGLHRLDNLQILTRLDNRRKGVA